MKTINCIKFYIGSNNKTNNPEIQKARSLIYKNGIKGFSIYKNLMGEWENTTEKSFIIEIKFHFLLLNLLFQKPFVLIKMEVY
jgi:hypothetical protein